MNDKLNWALEVEFFKAGRPYVRHRGHVYPIQFGATWRRTDGLEVELTIRVDADTGPIPTEVRIRNSAGIDSGDARQPIASMVRTAAAEVAMEETDAGLSPVAFAPPGQPVPMGQQAAKRTDRDRLERVTALYWQALEEGSPVTRLIERSEHVSQQTAYGLIREARRAELLPPSPRGRKAKNGTDNNDPPKGRKAGA